MNESLNEFEPIIAQLRELKNIQPDDSFKKRLNIVFVPNPRTSPFIFLFSMRFLLIISLILMTTTSIVIAAEHSKPGEILYPVKQVMKTVKTQFDHPEKPTSFVPQETPKETSPNEEQGEQNNSITQTVPSPTPTIISNPINPTNTVVPPTTPTPRAIESPTQTPLHIKAEVLGTSVSISTDNSNNSAQPTPTPTVTKNSILPNIEIDASLNKPLLKIKL